MAKKYYTVKDIVELLNGDLEKNDIQYRYNEQSVRARLRYLRSKGIENREKPVITPKAFGYDRRISLMEPMLPEFHTYTEDLPILEEVDEIEVRPSTIEDVEAISKLTPLNKPNDEKLIHDPIYRMVKEPNSKTFVSFTVDNEIIGWAQARISFALSVTRSANTGEIHFFVSPSANHRQIALRSLVHRAERWLILRDVQYMLLMVPPSMAEFEEYLRNIYLPDSIKFINLPNE
jgi:hypothetical protein